MMDQLLMVLIQRIFFFLNQPVSGTDDELARHAMQKAYIGFINSLVQSNLDGVLLSEREFNRLAPVHSGSRSARFREST
jgi:exportin-T